jgi:hypothetical protein
MPASTFTKPADFLNRLPHSFLATGHACHTGLVRTASLRAEEAVQYPVEPLSQEDDIR